MDSWNWIHGASTKDLQVRVRKMWGGREVALFVCLTALANKKSKHEQLRHFRKQEPARAA
jgi:hypothetical protein